MNRLRKAGAVGLVVGVAGLLLGPRPARAFPWSIDMFRGASVQPLAEAPRNQPPGTLPINGEPPMSRDVASRVLKNPLSPTPEVMAAGKRLWINDCTPCHGDGGRGDGTVRHLLKQPAADLTAGEPTERSDGYIYATIRNGSYIMPAYGDAMSPQERWEVVLYVRSLQGKVAAK